MTLRQRVNVAVLLATYNGSRYVAQQISSLSKNATPFTLHWLDDHSVDDTRDVVPTAARNAGIPIQEWHVPQHQGLPGSFFRLLDCVDSDIYLFCDQDDIWQPGKIDSTVEFLASGIESPLLCYSDSILFYEDGSQSPRRLSQVIGTKDLERDLKRPPTLQCFSRVHAPGHTQGLTRGLREIYLTHRNIARKYAFMHDHWMHDIAIATGAVRLINAPTALWRQHQDSFCAGLRVSPSNWISELRRSAQLNQLTRRIISRHSQGFLLASETLPAGEHLDRLVELAKLVVCIDQRQSVSKLVKLASHGASFPRWSQTASFFAICLCSSASRNSNDGNSAAMQ